MDDVTHFGAHREQEELSGWALLGKQAMIQSERERSIRAWNDRARMPFNVSPQASDGTR